MKKEEKRKHFTFYLDSFIIEKIRKCAEDDKRSLSREIEVILNLYLEDVVGDK